MDEINKLNHNEYAYLRQLPIDKLLELLAVAPVLSACSEDEAYVDALEEAIIEKESENSTGFFPDVDQQWEQFTTRYLPDVDNFTFKPEYTTQTVATQPNVLQKRVVRFKRVWRTALAAAAAVACMLAAMVTAQAAGVDVFGAMARWTQDVFSFGPVAPDSHVSDIPASPEQSPAISYRLVFPVESVFSCAESYSSLEPSIQLAKDGVENGRICYDVSHIPFSNYLLEHPDASLLMWMGVHQLLLESWEISLNDGWICYMYQGEMDHATGTEDPGGRGIAYSAMIGRPGSEYVFCLFWDNYLETPFEEPLESLQEDDPGYVSLGEMKSFLSGIVVEGES